MTLEQAVARMAQSNPVWGRPKGAEGQCKKASLRTSLYLEQCGYEVAYLVCDSPEAGGDHYALLVEGEHVVDMTARQFDPSAPFPWIVDVTEWKQWLTLDVFRRTTTFRTERIV